MAGISALVAAAAAVVTMLILLVTAIFVGRQVGDARRTRHGQLITDLSRRWDEPQIVQSQKIFSEYSAEGLVTLVNKVFGKGTDEATDKELDDFVVLGRFPNLIETVGVLHADGAIDISVINRMWGLVIPDSWDAWKPAVWRMREIADNDAIYTNFQDLSARIESYRRSASAQL
jgi:hypothetical protein